MVNKSILVFCILCLSIGLGGCDQQWKVVVYQDGSATDGQVEDDGLGETVADDGGFLLEEDEDLGEETTEQDIMDGGLDGDSAGDDSDWEIAGEFFVSPWGRDSSPGTIELPFLTLVRARDAVRELKQAHGLPDQGVVVWLRGGVYRQENTFVLEEQDSGEADKPITYRSYPDEEARLVGAVELDPEAFVLVDSNSPVWSRLDPAAQGNLWQIDLAAQGITDYGTLVARGFHTEGVAALELFFDRQPMQLGRWPDDGFVYVAGTVSDTQFRYSGDRPSRWSQAEEVWFHGYWKYLWADRTVAAVSIDTGSKIVTLTEQPGYGILSGQPYYAFNLLEEITVPGEWIVERDSGMLYFWPPADLSQAEIFVSTLQAPLVKIAGANYIVFRDLSLEMSREELLLLESGNNNRIEYCTLLNAGTHGAMIYGYDNGLDHCEIAEPGDAGVWLKGGVRASLTPANNYVSNCHIHHFGRSSWTIAPAVRMQDCGHQVVHNEIHDAPHIAILFKGNEHLIEFNDIHHVCQFSSDAGAIYSGRDWGYRGNMIRYNFIHSVDSPFSGYGEHGIYLDDCVSGMNVFGNIIYEVSGHAVQHGGGRDIIVENNIMVRCGDAFRTDNRGLNMINNTPGSSWNLLERLTYDDIQYQAEPWASAYPKLAVIPNDWAAIIAPGALWREPEGCVFSRNLGYQNSTWIIGSGTMDVFDEVSDNISNQNPLFEDEANLDLRLRPDSPAFDIPGFVDIPFEQIGIQR
jgi:hypothetical protein